MGSAPSKATRGLRREKPFRVGTRVLAPTTTEPAQRPERPLASGSKNEAIERDAMDPHFMEKLNQLGAVRVDHKHTVRATSDVRNVYHFRMRSEAEAASLRPTKNRLSASSLAELLEARKSIASNAGLEKLAKQYHIDAATLQRLGRIVNTPTVDERAVLRTTDERGEESLTMMAQWVDPVFSQSGDVTVPV